GQLGPMDWVLGPPTDGLPTWRRVVVALESRVSENGEHPVDLGRQLLRGRARERRRAGTGDEGNRQAEHGREGPGARHKRYLLARGKCKASAALEFQQLGRRAWTIACPRWGVRHRRGREIFKVVTS